MQTNLNQDTASPVLQRVMGLVETDVSLSDAVIVFEVPRLASFRKLSSEIDERLKRREMLDTKLCTAYAEKLAEQAFPGDAEGRRLATRYILSRMDTLLNRPVMTDEEKLVLIEKAGFGSLIKVPTPEVLSKHAAPAAAQNGLDMVKPVLPVPSPQAAPDAKLASPPVSAKPPGRWKRAAAWVRSVFR